MKRIKLTQGQYALVDDDLYNWLNQWSWYYKVNPSTGTGYAARTLNGRNGGKNKTIRMHNMILPPADGAETDHEDTNGLNNQRGNLRMGSKSQQGWNRRVQRNNTSGIKGVYYHKRDKKWRAQIRAQGRKITIGTYFTKEEAAAAYRRTAIKYHGEFVNGIE